MQSYTRDLHDVRSERGTCQVLASREPAAYCRTAWAALPWGEGRLVRVVEACFEGKPIGWFATNEIGTAAKKNSSDDLDWLEEWLQRYGPTDREVRSILVHYSIDDHAVRCIDAPELVQSERVRAVGRQVRFISGRVLPGYIIRVGTQVEHWPNAVPLTVPEMLAWLEKVKPHQARKNSKPDIERILAKQAPTDEDVIVTIKACFPSEAKYTEVLSYIEEIEPPWLFRKPDGRVTAGRHVRFRRDVDSYRDFIVTYRNFPRGITYAAKPLTIPEVMAWAEGLKTSVKKKAKAKKNPDYDIEWLENWLWWHGPTDVQVHNEVRRMVHLAAVGGATIARIDDPVLVFLDHRRRYGAVGRLVHFRQPDVEPAYIVRYPGNVIEATRRATPLTVPEILGWLAQMKAKKNPKKDLDRLEREAPSVDEVIYELDRSLRPRSRDAVKSISEVVFAHVLNEVHVGRLITFEQLERRMLCWREGNSIELSHSYTLLTPAEVLGLLSAEE